MVHMYAILFLLCSVLSCFATDNDQVFFKDEGSETTWRTASVKCKSASGELIYIEKNNQLITSIPGCSSRKNAWIGNLKIITPFLKHSGCCLAPSNSTIHNISGISVSKCYMKCNRTLPIAIKDDSCFCGNNDYRIFNGNSCGINFCKVCASSPSEVCGCAPAFAVYDRVNVDLNPASQEVVDNQFCLTKQHVHTQIETKSIRCHESNVQVYGVCGKNPEMMKFTEPQANKVTVKNGSWIANEIECLKNGSVLGDTVPTGSPYMINARKYWHVIRGSERIDKQFVEKLSTLNSVNYLCGYLNIEAKKVMFTPLCELPSALNLTSFLCSKNVSKNETSSQCSMNITINDKLSKTTSFDFNKDCSMEKASTILTVTTTRERFNPPKESFVSSSFVSHSTESVQRTTKLQYISTYSQIDELDTTHKVISRNSALSQGTTSTSSEMKTSRCGPRENDITTMFKVSQSVQKSPISTGAIVGIVIGIAVIVTFVGIVVFIRCRKQEKGKDKAKGFQIAMSSIIDNELGQTSVIPVVSSSESVPSGDNQPVYAVVSKSKKLKNDEDKIPRFGIGENENTQREDIEEVYIESNDAEYDQLRTKRNHKIQDSFDDEYSTAQDVQDGEFVYSLAVPIREGQNTSGYSEVRMKSNVEDEHL